MKMRTHVGFFAGLGILEGLGKGAANKYYRVRWITDLKRATQT